MSYKDLKQSFNNNFVPFMKFLYGKIKISNISQ